MTKIGRPEKEKKAFVCAGRSALTNLGIAHEGAAITPAMLATGTKDEGLGAFYKLLKAEVIAYPPTEKDQIAAGAGNQLGFGDKPPVDESPADGPPADDPPADDPPAAEPPAADEPPEKSKKIGAKRKNKR